MKNIFLIGMMGTGKSTIGKLLSKDLDLNFIDTDKQIEKHFNMPINNIFAVSYTHQTKWNIIAIKFKNKFIRKAIKGLIK